MNSILSRLLALTVVIVAIACVSRCQAESTAKPLVLAHYMPWYSIDSMDDRWGWHWTMNHFDPRNVKDGKRQIASKYYPLIGPYDSGDLSVIEFHLLTMKLAGIDGVIVDWYGLTNFRDYAVLHTNTTRVLEQCERLKLKFVICYEDQTIPALVAAGRLKQTERSTHAINELNWLHKYWFKSPSYVRFDERPVMLSFGHAGLTDREWRECLTQTSIAYFSQDYLRDGAAGVFDWPNPRRGVDRVNQFFREATHWPDSIPVIFPRFDDIYQEAGVSEGYPVIPDGEGATFKRTLELALKANRHIVQIATWNDWGEGTQIEPSTELGYRDLEVLRNTLSQFNSENESKSAEILRLPFRILELRREGRVKESDLEGVIEQICLGNAEIAKNQLSQLER